MRLYSEPVRPHMAAIANGDAVKAFAGVLVAGFERIIKAACVRYLERDIAGQQEEPVIGLVDGLEVSQYRFAGLANLTDIAFYRCWRCIEDRSYLVSYNIHLSPVVICLPGHGRLVYGKIVPFEK